MNRPQIVIVSGKKNSGKTAYLQEIRQRAQKRGWQVGGFLSEAKLQNNVKTQYRLLNLQTEEQRILAWRKSDSSALATGRFAFDPTVFAWGNRFVRQQLHFPVIILDEFGPLEMRGKGWFDLLGFLLAQYRGLLFISVRPDLLSSLMHLIGTKVRT